MFKITSVSLLLSVMAFTSAHADFSGGFSPVNWTFTQINSDGIVDTSGAPLNVIISSSNNGSGQPGSTIYTIAAPSDGTVSFNWNYQQFDTFVNPLWDDFGYIQDGSFVQLSVNGGPTIQSGTIAFAVLAGLPLGFRASSFDGLDGPSVTTVSNFNFTPSETEIPFGVDSTLGLSFLGLAGAWKLRRRKTA